jgi:hypothetical protein
MFAQVIHHEVRQTKSMTWLEKVQKTLFGFDFFSSYAFEDGRAYATAREANLRGRYRCFLDQKEMPARQNLIEATHNGVLRCNVLLLILTPARCSF